MATDRDSVTNANTSTDTIECRQCPEGTECDSVGNELPTLLLKEGYYRTTPKSHMVYVCSSEDACRGGNATGSALCSEGYEAILCSSCSGGFFFDSLTRTCRDCEATRVTPAMVVVSVVVVVAGGMLIFMRDKTKQWADKWINMGKVRIVYTTYQVILVQTVLI